MKYSMLELKKNLFLLFYVRIIEKYVINKNFMAKLSFELTSC